MLRRPTLEHPSSSVQGEQNANEDRETTQLPEAQSDLEKEPDSWGTGVKMVNEPKMDGNAWERCKRAIDRHDDDLCRGWREDVDTMLVFAGLFSAAVTAFCVEAFQWLSQDPAETTNALLYHLSLQFANSSSSPAQDPASIVNSFVAAKHDVQINILYFLSLTMALSVSFICILCKQWLREYQRDIAVSHRDAIRLRQLRYEGLIAWRVPQILAALPVILQVSLLAFFAGLLEQLWHLHFQVAGVVTALVGLTILLVLVTTIAPAHRRLVCAKWSPYEFVPFRSPQAWLYSTLITRVVQLFKDIPNFSWSAFDIQHLDEEFLEVQPYGEEVTSLHRALRWTHEVLGHTGQVGIMLYWCMLPENNDPNHIWVADTLPQYVTQEDEHCPAYLQLLFSGDALADSSHFASLTSLHAELLIRDMNITFWRSSWNTREEHWLRISGGLRLLASTHLRPWPKANSLENEQVLVQIAMVVRELVGYIERARPPPSFSWNAFLDIVGTLSQSRSALARQIVSTIPSKMRMTFPRRPDVIPPFVSDMAYISMNEIYYAFPKTMPLLDNEFGKDGIYMKIFDVLDELMVWASSHATNAVSLEWRKLWSEARVEMETRAGLEKGHFKTLRPGLLPDEADEPLHEDVRLGRSYHPVYIRP